MKKNSREIAEEVEKEIIAVMEQQHIKRISICTYINNLKLLASVEPKWRSHEEEKQKQRLLGSLKGFKRLRRTYQKQGRYTQLYLEMV